MDPLIDDRQTRPFVRFACLAGLLLLIANVAAYYSVADDAYIGFRYLDNWLAGHGLTFNPGERVEGYTNFLWLVALAPPRLMGLAPETAAFGLSLAALALLLWAVYRTASDLAGHSAAGCAALLLAAGSVHLARWTSSGMETVFFAALLALANQQLAARRAHGPGSSLAFGLAVLTRPPAALHGATAFAAALPWRGPDRVPRTRRLLLPALFFLALPAAHVAFRLWYYGFPVPNTAYVKLGGDPQLLVPSGLTYLKGFLLSGGSILVVCAALALAERKAWNWVVAALAAQAILHAAYVVWIGGDYFAFHRFLVPIIPALAVLGGVGLAAAAGRVGPRASRLLPAIALLLAVLETGLGYGSRDRAFFETTKTVRAERELIAQWLTAQFPADSSLALNAAGLIPYRTGMPTIDMLGLNDAHIARTAPKADADGFIMVGHVKHDGQYVCDRAPDIVLTAGAALHPGRSADEAVMQAVNNTFPGDREFLRAPACRDAYHARTEELAPGRFVVAYVRTPATTVQPSAQPDPTTPAEWFERGIALMQAARLPEAITAFQRSLALNPGHPAVMTNMGFCYSDLGQYAQAVAVFEQVLKSAPRQFDALYGLALAHERQEHRAEAIALWRRYIAEAPDSPWKREAREHLQILTGTSR